MCKDATTGKIANQGCWGMGQSEAKDQDWRQKNSDRRKTPDIYMKIEGRRKNPGRRQAAIAAGRGTDRVSFPVGMGRQEGKDK